MVQVSFAAANTVGQSKMVMPSDCTQDTGRVQLGALGIRLAAPAAAAKTAATQDTGRVQLGALGIRLAAPAV